MLPDEQKSPQRQGAAAQLFHRLGGVPPLACTSDCRRWRLRLHPDRACVLAGNDSQVARLALCIAKKDNGLPGITLQTWSRVVGAGSVASEGVVAPSEGLLPPKLCCLDQPYPHAGCPGKQPLAARRRVALRGLLPEPHRGLRPCGQCHRAAAGQLGGDPRVGQARSLDDAIFDILVHRAGDRHDDADGAADRIAC